jgi:hypothetical protein
LFQRGIFILTAQSALQLYQTLVQIFQYAEKKLVTNREDYHQRNQILNSEKIRESAAAKLSDSLRGDDTSEQSSAELSDEVEVEDNSKSDRTELKIFAEVDFPALSLEDDSHALHESKFEVPRSVGRKGNQKQRKLEQLTEQPKATPKSQWTIMRNDKVEEIDTIIISTVERYRGLMRKHEKELIAKIQISQLVTDNPFADDYYFQMYKKQKDSDSNLKSKNKGKKSKKWIQSANQLCSGTTVSNQMQQQMKRLIESRRTSKPKENSCKVSLI